MRQILLFRLSILAELVLTRRGFMWACEKVMVQSVDKLVSLQLLLLAGVHVDEHGDHSLLLILLGLSLSGSADCCAVLLEPLHGLTVVFRSWCGLRGQQVWLLHLNLGNLRFSTLR